MLPIPSSGKRDWEDRARPVAAPSSPPSTPFPPPPHARPTPDVTLPPGMDDRRCRELFARYVKARQLVGEQTDDITYEKLVASLSKQASSIMAEHGARAVDFQVVVRGDRVVLKAKPLKGGTGK